MSHNQAIKGVKNSKITSSSFIVLNSSYSVYHISRPIIQILQAKSELFDESAFGFFKAHV